METERINCKRKDFQNPEAAPWLLKGSGGAGTGDVVGPASAVDNALARFDGTTGKLIQNSVVTVSDGGNFSGMGTLNGHTIPGGSPGTFALVSQITGTNSGTNTGDQTIALTGDVTGSGTGSFPATIANNAVTLAKQADIATARILGRATSGTGDPEALTGTQATALLDAFSSGAKGLAPASGGGTTNFLRADGSWSNPSGGGGTGDVVGPVSATDSAFSRFDSTTGKLIQDSAVVCDDAGNVTTPGLVNTSKVEFGPVDAENLALVPVPDPTDPTLTVVTTDGSASARLQAKELKTDDPGSGQGVWKLGLVQSSFGLALSTTTYVELKIGETVVKLGIVQVD